MRSLVRWLIPAFLCGCGSAPRGSGEAPVVVAPVIASTQESSSPPDEPAPPVDCKKSSGRVENEAPPSSAGWVRKGEVTVTMARGVPVQIEVRDISGAVVKLVQMVIADRRYFREYLIEAICHAGGLAVVPGPSSPRREPQDGLIIADILAPEAEDERADLTLMCKSRPRDPGAPPMVAIADMDQDLKWMTSRRLRQFHQGVLEMMEAEPAPGGITHFHDRADELAKIVESAGFPQCNYVDLLREIP